MFETTGLTPRRRFLRGIVLGSAAFFTTPGLFAEELARTPAMTEGPFYPDRLPLDTDNDLIILGNSLTPAIGEITHLTGRVLDSSGSPVRDAVVEIWQCDGRGVYLHSADSGPAAQRRDANFQGFGRFTTAANGEYRFRTIKPVQYPGRPAPHIHFKVKKGDRELLTTQLMIRGHEGNLRDGVFSAARDLIERELLMTDFKAIPDSKTGEFAARFDIIVGRTPDERNLRS